MRTRHLAILIPVLLFCVSCGDDRGTGGIQFDEHGATFDTASAAKHKAEATITHAVTEEVGVTWRVGTTILEEPEWNAANEQWRWNQATATVTLAGSGPLPNEPEIGRAVTTYLVKHQRPGAPAPKVIVHVERQGMVTTNGETPVVPAAPAAGWRYTIKAGDTLALLSSAFYGTPEHWRHILDANPGLQPDALTAGLVILVPPAPER